MTGVEILAMQEVTVATAFCWPAFWITFGVILAGLIAMALLIKLNGCEEEGVLITCIIAGLILGTMLGAMVGGIFSEPTEYETEYKVTIDDTVSMNEFLERYEIIDQEGKIYTVREKN